MEVAPNGATFSFITIKYLSMSLHTSLHLISTLALLVLASIAIVFFTPSAHAITARVSAPTLPYPVDDGVPDETIPYRAWNRCTARCVAGPKYPVISPSG